MSPLRRPSQLLARRSLTRAHIAFYRAVIEGVETQRAWSQYLQLEGEFTEGLATAAIGWVRQALIAEAMANGQPSLIGLFRRDPRRLKGGAAPTLEEFASRFADAGEFSEAELLAMWQEEHGGERASLEERRARLSRRLREALQWLERSVRQAPRLGDPVGQWLSPTLSLRLREAGLHSLGDLSSALASRQRQRWGAVRGVGPVWADRLAAWLRDSGLAAAPLEPVNTSPLRPLHAQAGEHAEARLIEDWLRARAGNTHTQRSYRKAAERLLLWCLHERRTALVDLSPEDGLHYRRWLQDLGGLLPDEWAARGWRWPQEAWFGVKGRARDGADWRPFALGAQDLADRAAQVAAGERPARLLSPASVSQELAVLRAMFRHLRDLGVTRANPWPAGTGAPAASLRARERSFSAGEWACVAEAATAAKGERGARLEAVLWLAFGCGLRAGEIVSLTLGSVREGPEGWQLSVAGRGGRARLLPVPRAAQQAVARYLATFGIEPPFAPHPPALPLLRGRRGRRRRDGGNPPITPLGYQTLRAELKQHLSQCADRLEAGGQVDNAARLRRASAHWVRHSCAVIGLDTGALDLAALREVLGHASMASTQAYAAPASADLRSGLERLTSGSDRG